VRGIPALLRADQSLARTSLPSRDRGAHSFQSRSHVFTISEFGSLPGPFSGSAPTADGAELSVVPEAQARIPQSAESAETRVTSAGPGHACRHKFAGHRHGRELER